MKKKIVAIAILTLTVMACNTAKKASEKRAENEKALIGPSWDLVTLKGETIAEPNASAEKIYFSMKSDDNRVGGYSGCNNFMGSYTLEKNNQIHFSPMATTRKACPDMEINESEILKVFDQAETYKVKGDRLTLKNKDGEVLAVFAKGTEETAPKVTEKYWKLKTLEGQEVEMAEHQERERYFMLKNDDNHVRGFSGCNSFSGKFSLEKGERIHFSQMASTMKACPDVDVDEAAFLKIFELADNYRINGDKLELNVGRRAPLAVFEAVYFD